jgi:hypothetical protein
LEKRKEKKNLEINYNIPLHAEKSKMLVDYPSFCVKRGFAFGHVIYCIPICIAVSTWLSERKVRV